MSEFSLT